MYLYKKHVFFLQKLLNCLKEIFSYFVLNFLEIKQKNWNMKYKQYLVPSNREMLRTNLELSILLRKLIKNEILSSLLLKRLYWDWYNERKMNLKKMADYSAIFNLNNMIPFFMVYQIWNLNKNFFWNFIKFFNYIVNYFKYH